MGSQSNVSYCLETATCDVVMYAGMCTRARSLSLSLTHTCTYARAHAHAHTHQVSCKMGFHLVYIKLNNFFYEMLFSNLINGFLFRKNEDHNKIRDGEP